MQLPSDAAARPDRRHCVREVDCGAGARGALLDSRLPHAPTNARANAVRRTSIWMRSHTKSPRQASRTLILSDESYFIQAADRGHAALLATFGPSILAADGTVDRAALGERVFADASLRGRLNAAMRRPLAWALISALVWHWLAGTDCVVLDAALLIESGLYRLCHAVLVVTATPALQQQRLASRNDYNAEEADARIRAQLSDEQRVRYATHVIPNEGSEQELRYRAVTVFKRIRGETRVILTRNRVLAFAIAMTLAGVWFITS